MSINITNQVASQALRSENATVTLTWAASNANVANFTIGQKCGVVSSGKIGYITEIDNAGLIVQIKPAQPDARFDSLSTPGILAANEAITFF